MNSVLYTAGDCSSRTAEDLRCYFVKNSVMRTRRSVLVGVSSAFVLAGCTESDSEPTTEGDDDDASPTEESFEILNPQLNGQPLDQYDVDFPADVTPEQLADEFQHQLEYETQGANGPAESTINVEYTENTIPNTPLNEEIESDQYPDTETIEQQIQFPDHLVEHLIENPRNIQATLQSEDTETGQTTNREFTLNYADEYAEQVHRAAFQSDDTRFGNSELIDITIKNGLIDLEYKSDHEIGTREFDTDLTSGIYSGIIDTTRTPYKMDFTVKDANEDIHQVDIDNDLAIEYLNGEITRGELRDSVYFEEMRITD